MDPASFWAGTTGRVETADGVYGLTVHDLGLLHVPSGELGVCDPFFSVLEPLTFAVPAGSYPVRVTLADVSAALDGSHEREAYVSLVVAEGEVARIEHLVPVDQMTPEDDAYYGVSVDSSSVALVDSAAVVSSLPEQSALLRFYRTPGGWFERQDDPGHLRQGWANVDLPGASAGENVVVVHSGWGDGFYPVLGTFDADFRLLGVHIDLEVVQ